MAGVGLAPRRSAVTEDIRDFQNRPPHEGWGLCGRLGASRLQRGQAIQRAHDVPDDVGGNARVKRGRIERISMFCSSKCVAKRPQRTVFNLLK
jgi:hypothetical protein